MIEDGDYFSLTSCDLEFPAINSGLILDQLPFNVGDTFGIHNNVNDTFQ